jgi:hypothetical protein
MACLFVPVSVVAVFVVVFALEQKIRPVALVVLFPNLLL